MPPRRICRSTPSTATVSPNFFTRDSVWTAISASVTLSPLRFGVVPIPARHCRYISTPGPSCTVLFTEGRHDRPQTGSLRQNNARSGPPAARLSLVGLGIAARGRHVLDLLGLVRGGHQECIGSIHHDEIGRAS